MPTDLRGMFNKDGTVTLYILLQEIDEHEEIPSHSAGYSSWAISGTLGIPNPTSSIEDNEYRIEDLVFTRSDIVKLLQNGYNKVTYENLGELLLVERI